MRALLMSSVVASLVLASAVAQAAPTTREEVKVPFPFVVNGYQLPAGTYSVRQDDEQSNTFLIQGSGGSVFVLTSPVSTTSVPQDTSFVFAKDGDRYRLAEIWNDGGDGVAVLNNAK